MQHPVKPVETRRAGASRHSDHRHAVKRRCHQKVSGVGRQAQSVNLSAGRLDGGGHHIAPVTDRRRPADEDRLGPMRARRLDGGRDGLWFMRDHTAVDKGAAKLVEPQFRHLLGIGQQCRLDAGHACLDQRERPCRQRVKPENRRSATLRFNRLDRSLAYRIGDDLQCGDHVAILDKLVVLHAGKRDSLVDPVHLLQPVPVEADDSASDSIDIDPSSGRRRQTKPRRHERCRQPVCGGVLVEIAALEPGNHDLGDAGSLDPVKIGPGQTCPLADAAIGKMQSVGQNGAITGLCRNRTELHLPGLTRDPPDVRQRSPDPGSRRRSRPVSWPRYRDLPAREGGPCLLARSRLRQAARTVPRGFCATPDSQYRTHRFAGPRSVRHHRFSDRGSG